MYEQNAAGVSKFKYKGSKGLAYLKLGSGQLQAVEFRQHPREEKGPLLCIHECGKSWNPACPLGFQGRIGIKEIGQLGSWWMLLEEISTEMHSTCDPVVSSFEGQSKKLKKCLSVGKFRYVFGPGKSSYPTVLVCSGCYSKIAQTGWLLNNRKRFFLLVETGSLRSGCQPSAEGPLGMHTPPCVPAWQEGLGSSSESADPSFSHLNTSHRSYLLTTLRWVLEFQHINLTGCIQITEPPETLLTIRLLLGLLPFIKYIVEQESKTKMLVASSVFL